MNAPVSTAVAVHCSCCGTPLPDRAAEVLIETDSGTVRVGEDFVHLSRTEMVILSHLAEVSPRMLTKQALWDWLYQLDPDGGPEMQTILVFVSKIRRKIRALGMDIENIFGSGYRFKCQRTVSILRPIKAPEAAE
ncbi:MAG: hypothetical protein CML29_17370 [Rhizobiales bacterium]|nr:hypothetical protein [Hyphomicrobiales bacterium]MBA68648.1 hypothetical protein [Hyphomicrobiales bacterium]